MDDKFVPLRMGDKIIGTAKFDSETGEITGNITDPAFGALLTEGFAGNLYEISIYGKPAIPAIEVQQRFNDWYANEVRIGKWERDNTTKEKND